MNVKRQNNYDCEGRLKVETFNSVDSPEHCPIKEKINHFLYTPANIVILAILTLIAFCFSLEVIFYTLVILYALYVIIFCPDLTPLMPLFTLCYFTVSKKNNPGITDQGIFYGKTATFFIVLVAVVIIALLIRISVDKKIGWKALFTKRRKLLSGLLVLSLAYLISGLGSEHYLQYAKNNLVFASVQALSVFLLYFVFSSTIDWEKFDVDYFAYSQLISGLVVLFELFWIYVTENVITAGVIDRELIFTGWGTYNNIGVILSMSIPFAFYFACKKKHGVLYMIPALMMMVGIVFSCSRASLICAALALIASFVYTFAKADNKFEFQFFSVIILLLLAISSLFLVSSFQEVFQNVPTIVDIVNGDIVFNDYDRFNIYAKGWEAFVKNPIFGQTFYSPDYFLFDFSEVEQFSTFFPPRWHNTFIQLLASCGIVGLLAYLYHRAQTVILFIKKRTRANVYIVLSLLTMLGASLLDNHFFNVGPVLIYSMALAVMEFGKTDDR